MTEREVFEEVTPRIAKIIIYMQQLSNEEAEKFYTEWKAEIEKIDNKQVKGLMEKVFTIAKSYC